MARTQAEVERIAGDCFIAWYNESHRRKYLYAGRPSVAPDLEYRDGPSVLHVEVTEAFYDDDADPKFKWKNLRGDADAPRVWAGVEPDDALAFRIATRLTEKSVKDYGPDCVLLVHIDPTMSNPEDVERILTNISVPARHSFQGIYVAGFFGFSSGNEAPGYRCWRLYEA